MQTICVEEERVRQTRACFCEQRVAVFLTFQNKRQTSHLIA